MSTVRIGKFEIEVTRLDAARVVTVRVRDERRGEFRPAIGHLDFIDLAVAAAEETRKRETGEGGCTGKT